MGFRIGIQSSSKALIAKTRPAERISVSYSIYLPLLWPLLWSQQDKSPRSLLTVVVEVTGPFCNVRTFVGTQLRSTSHRIKTSDCYRVPSELTNLRPFDLIDDADSFSADETPQHVQRPQSHQWYRVRTWLLLLRMFPNKATLLPAQMRLPTCRPAPIQTEPSLDSDSDYDANPGGGGEVLPYMGYIGMCRFEGYGFQDILNSASRMLQCWSYYVKFNSARHQPDTERTQNRVGS